MSSQNPEVKILESKRVFDGFFKMDLHKIEVGNFGGGTRIIHRLNFERGHAVSVLAYDPPADTVALIREFRHGILLGGGDPFMPQVCAGMIDKGEEASQAGLREGSEEMAVEVKDIHVFHPGAFVSPGGTSEKIALAVGIVDTSKMVNGSVHGKVEEGEDIQTVLMPAREFIARAKKGELNDMKTVLSAFWLAANRPKLRKQYPAHAPKAGNAPKP